MVSPSGPGSSGEGATARSPRAALPSEDELVFADADGGAPADALDASGPTAFGIWDLARMVLVLLLVVGAVYGLILLLRQRTARGNDTDADSPIRVLATRSLGNNRDVHVVMIGSEVMVLGGGEGGVQLLRTIDDQETIDELVLAHSATVVPGSGRGFASTLARWIGSFSGRVSLDDDAERATADDPGSPVTLESSSSFLSSQQSRLRQMR